MWFEAVVKKEGIDSANEQTITYLVNWVSTEVQTTKADAKDEEVDAWVENKFCKVILGQEFLISLSVK